MMWYPKRCNLFLLASSFCWFLPGTIWPENHMSRTVHGSCSLWDLFPSELSADGLILCALIQTLLELRERAKELFSWRQFKRNLFISMWGTLPLVPKLGISIWAVSHDHLSSSHPLLIFVQFLFIVSWMWWRPCLPFCITPGHGISPSFQCNKHNMVAAV